MALSVSFSAFEEKSTFCTILLASISSMEHFASKSKSRMSSQSCSERHGKRSRR